MRNGYGDCVHGDVVGWVVSGAVVGVVAPGVLLGTRRRIRWDALALPAVPSLVGFVLLHALITFALTRHPPAGTWVALHVPLLVGAIVYWLPVFGTRRRLPDALRVLYLFLSAPPLDLSGVMVVILGDPSGGVAMIVGMLPAGLVAVAVTWQWINQEEDVVLVPPAPR
jgi:cytochrome c oxidase assembly factor CtaG